MQIIGILYDSRIWEKRDAADAILGVLHELTEPWRKKPSCGAKEVVDILDPAVSKWCAAGVHVDEIPVWRHYGFGPDLASEWVRNGLGCHVPMLWSRWGKISNFDPAVVAGWEQHLRSGEWWGEVDRRDLFSWVALGVPAKPGVLWWDAGWGWHDPQVVKQWMNAFEGVLDPAPLLVNMSNGRSISEVKEWFDSGIAGVDLEVLDRKGYTPKEAADALTRTGDARLCERIDVSVESQHIELHGEDWQQICAAAQQQNWHTCKIVEDELLGQCVVWFGREGSTLEPRAVFKNGFFSEGRIVVLRNEGKSTTVESDLTIEDFLTALRFTAGNGDRWWESMYGKDPQRNARDSQPVGP